VALTTKPAAPQEGGTTGRSSDAAVEAQLPGGQRELTRAQHLLDAHTRVHGLMAGQAPLADVLAELVRGIEAQSDGMLGSVLLLDPDGMTLRHGAAPNLPAAYMVAIDGVPVGPDVGSCGSAAHSGREVFVSDIASDPRWRDYRGVALDNDLQACWSVPVLNAGGAVLGTFALYYGAPRPPTPSEVQLIRQASRLAAIAIERHRSHEELKRLASRDTLTGLPNRALLMDGLAEALARCTRLPEEDVGQVAVLFCDLDRFKLVNDSMGHEVGDWILGEVGRLLAASVRPGDTVARFGGDEFVVVAEGVTGSSAAALAERLHAALTPSLLHDHSGEHSVSATIGVAVLGAGASTADAIRWASSARYDAKRKGLGTGVYSAELHQRATAQMRLDSALRRAIEREQLHLAYQPIVRLADDRTVAVEALLRWDHPELGPVSPADFIPAAEETGLILRLGDWVLAQAAAQARAWNGPCAEPLSVAVNVSARQLADRTLPDRVERILAAESLDPALLVLEVTETALVDHDVLAAASLSRLHALGVRVALDDFGTGYSSFGRLRRLPIDAIKIDREFTAGLGTDRDATAIVTAMIGLAHGLDLSVTAEGVETEAQLSALRALGCTHVQGFGIARPQRAADIAEQHELDGTDGDGQRD
jgi:diguanylate cyclase (GGDEF)-like protein